jgi:hypothetical protein
MGPSDSADWTYLTPAIAVEVLTLLLVAAFWLWVRRQNAVHVGPRNNDFGDEPPAVVNLLAHGMKVTAEAAAATALDLAARGHVDIDEIDSSLSLVHVREGKTHDALLPFERLVLDALAALEVDGVVPAEACSLGPEALSWRWWRRFSAQVGDEAVHQGLAGMGFVGSVFLSTEAPAISRWWLLSSVLLVIPPGLLLLGTQHSNDLASWLALFSYAFPLAAVYSITRARYIATERGRAAASRWMGTRRALSEGEFDQHPPASVRIWGRALAYAVALGLAKHTARGLPFSAEDDFHGWSAAGGSWHPIRIAYPMWLPGWGRRTLGVLGWSLLVASVALGAGLAMWSRTSAPGGRQTAVVLFIVAALALLEALVAAADLGPAVTIEGEVIRLRARFPDFERGLLTIVVHRPRWFVAVDNNRRRMRAISIREQDFDQLADGDHVRVTVSRFLKYARSIRVVDEEDDAEYVIRDRVDTP